MKNVNGRFMARSRKAILMLLPLAIILLVTSCEDLDFPDPNAPGLPETTVQTLVTGTESGMRIDYEFYLRSVSVIGREAYYLEPADPRYTGELLGKNGSDLDPSGFLLVRSWTSRYRVIRNCNFLLDKGDRGADGFAKTVLAYQLLLNLDMTDSNGIRTDVAGASPGPFVTRTQGYAAIDSLLDGAIGDLNAAGDKFNFVLSAGFHNFDTPPEFKKFN